MKAEYDSFEVFNNIVKERGPVQHAMLVGQNTDRLKAWSCKECADEGPQILTKDRTILNR